MFKEWGFLLSEIWFLVLLAGLVGLIAGWLVWGGRSDADGAGGGDPDMAAKASDAQQAAQAAQAEVDQLSAKLERCRADGARKDDRIREVETELDELRGRAAFTAPIEAFEPDDPDDETIHRYDQEAGQDPETAEADGSEDAEDEPSEAVSPASLEGPREGGADDLKKIKGIGPKLEALVNSMGFYHYDQIADWTEAEVSWVDDNLEGFKGRVSRDNWVAQAKALAEDASDK